MAFVSRRGSDPPLFREAARVVLSREAGRVVLSREAAGVVFVGCIPPPRSPLQVTALGYDCLMCAEFVFVGCVLPRSPL